MPYAKTQAVAFILFVVFAFCGCSSHGQESVAIEKAFAAEIARYPQATLIDVYKFFFQDAFGPGHMIPDTAAARRYLEKELKAAAGFDSVLWYPIGYKEEYYRINLKAVQDGKITFEELLQAFVESANSALGPSVEEWRKEWKLILEAVEKHRGQLANFDADKARLEEMLGSGEIVVHHSPIFEEKYRPHYRVIHRRYFEELKSTH